MECKFFYVGDNPSWPTKAPANGEGERLRGGEMSSISLILDLKKQLGVGPNG